MTDAPRRGAGRALRLGLTRLLIEVWWALGRVPGLAGLAYRRRLAAERRLWRW